MRSEHKVIRSVLEAVSARLPQNLRIRRNLPGGGRLKIDRQLPFLFVYRSPPGEADAGTRELVTTEAAYLVGSAEKKYHAALSRICRRISGIMLEHFGMFLIVEVWSAAEPEGKRRFPIRPRFEIITSEEDSETMPTTIEAFQRGLNSIRIGEESAQVEVKLHAEVAPPGHPPLLGAGEAHAGCYCIGLGIDPVYRRSGNGMLFPMVLEQLRRQLPLALRKGVFAFAGIDGEPQVGHFHAFGPSSMAQSVRQVDQRLSEVADSFDFILQATPVNGERAWREFSESGFERAPTLYYRPLPYHPGLLKRRLFDIPVERVEDSTLSHLFWEKQNELDHQITALRELERPSFLYSSLALYGGVSESLFELARNLLEAASRQDAGDDDAEEEPWLGAREVAEGAREEIDFYHQLAPIFTPAVEICDNITSGILVSQGRLYVSESIRISPQRLEPLLHHEVGTHLVTYFNGLSQPFRQLHAGLAGYEALQEGLAVLAEYLVGGLSPSRVRTLAGRVIAVRSLVDGADFVGTFRLLREDYGFAPKSAYNITLRVHRGGGLTKDAIYLRGLQDVFDYLCGGHEIEPLFVGKIALKHVPFVQELRRREVIQAPLVLPRFWQSAPLRERLNDCRKQSLLELLELSP